MIANARREADPGPFGNLLNTLHKYRALAYLLAAFLLAAGFGFKTPSERFSELDSAHHQRMDAIASRVDSAQAELDRALPLIETSAIIACLSIPEREAAQYRLPCRRLLEGYERPSRMGGVNARR